MAGGSRVRMFSVFALLGALSGCGNLDQVGETLASVADRPTGGNDVFGPGRVVEGWQKPMPDPTLAQGWVTHP